MKKKGFTLVEILAVVVILGLLAVIVMPNVLDMFNEAKQKTFETELKEIYRAAQQQWVSDSKEDLKVFAQSKNDNCESKLDLSGRKSIDYFIQMDAKGNIVRYYASDGTYQYQYIGTGLKISEIENSIEISKITSDNKISISCDVESGVNYFTSAPHKINNKTQLLNSMIKMYPTYNQAVSETNNRFFLRYTLDSYKEEAVETFYCAKVSDGYDSCIMQGIQFDTLDACNATIEEWKDSDPSGSGYTYSCYESSNVASSGFITGKVLGFEKNGTAYYLNRKDGFETNKNKLYGAFGAANCSIGCNNSVNDQNSDGEINYTPSKMAASDHICYDQYIICTDNEIGLYYSNYEAYIENKDGDYFSRSSSYNYGGYPYGIGLAMGAKSEVNYIPSRMVAAGPSFNSANGPGYFCTENAGYSECGVVSSGGYYYGGE